MPTTACLTPSMLSVGMSYEAELSFSHAEVRQYCELSGDRNAIHREPAAAQLRFPDVNDIVVPGGLIQIAITGLFGTQFPGDGSLGLTFSPDRFRKPVCPGETIRIVITIARIRAGMIELDIAIFDRAGTRIGSANSRVMAPDDNYREWWLAQQSAEH